MKAKTNTGLGISKAESNSGIKLYYIIIKKNNK